MVRFNAALGIGIGILIALGTIPTAQSSFALAFNEFEADGIFRPIYWVGVTEVGSPIFGVCVAVATAGAFLIALTGFGVGVPVSCLIVLLWTWHPFHAGVWQRLEAAEALAIPLTLLALECARRAAKADASRLWELGWIAAAVFAILSRNAFIGIVPALALTRLGPDEFASKIGGFFQMYRGAVLCGAMLLLGGTGLSSTLGIEAKPELAIVALGLYVLLAALLNGLAEAPVFQVRRVGWVGAGAVLAALLMGTI